MTLKPRGFARAALLVFGASALACSGTPTEPSEIQQALEQKNQRVSELERALRDSEQRIETQEGRLSSLSRDLDRARADVAAAPPTSAPGGDLLPPAVPGQCFARVLVPAQYRSETEQVLKREAGEKIEIVPAKYEWVEERVLVKEASETIQEVPAQYAWVEEKVLVKPAHTVWKKGRGPIERVDHSTGEIMCLVEVPAQYQTLRKRVMKQPPTTRRVAIPAEYKTVKVRKQAQPAREQRIAIPAQYGTVTRSLKTSEERMQWRPVLCQTNATPQLIQAVQRALRDAGHNPGPTDGVLGRQTLTAVRSFQAKKGLPTGGGLTMSTLDSLGVKTNR